jgi:hypothetical protein
MNEPTLPFLVTHPGTGAVTQKRLLSQDEIAFEVRMALRGSALSGLPHKDRPHMKEIIERAIVEHFRLCRYEVFGIVPKNGPVG